MDLFDFEYWSELGEIISNVFAAVMRGEVSEQDARDYLQAITEPERIEA